MMNPMAQPDLHPDSDILNAFVERVLPDTERARVLAHMADCGRCRDIVFLAQAAAQQEVASLVHIGPQNHPGWFAQAFARWRFALIPAAAFASVGAVVLWIHLHPAPPQVNVAISTPQMAPPAGETASQTPTQTAVRAQESAGPQSKASDAVPANPGSTNSHPPQTNPQKPAQGLAPSRAQIAPLPPPVGGSSIPGDFSQRQAAAAIHLDPRSAALAQYAPPPQPAASPEDPARSQALARAERSRRALSAPRDSAQEALRSAANPASPPVPPGETPNRELDQAVRGSFPLTAQSASGAEAAPQPMNGFALMRLAKRAKLPSGLDTVSSAAALNRLVAIDSAGSVFLSQDGGTKWEPVTAQWTGKAVAVKAPPPAVYPLMTASVAKSPDANAISLPPVAPGAPGEEPAAAGAPSTIHAPSPKAPDKAKNVRPVPDLVFRLVTDRRQVWVSQDGKVWRRE